MNSFLHSNTGFLQVSSSITVPDMKVRVQLAYPEVK